LVLKDTTVLNKETIQDDIVKDDIVKEKPQNKGKTKKIKLVLRGEKHNVTKKI